MDIRWLHVLLALSTFLPGSTTEKSKRRKQGQSAQVAHVASGRYKLGARNNLITSKLHPSPEDLSNLVITNTHKKSFHKLKIYLRHQLKARKMSFRAIRKMYKKNIKRFSEKGRRRAVKKLRHEITVLRKKAIKGQKQCKSTKDCSINECCLFRFHTGKRDGKGHCKMRPKLHQRCKLALLPGLDTECPCQTGLTCNISSKPGHRPKPRCKLVKYTDDEYQQQSITGLGQ